MKLQNLIISLHRLYGLVLYEIIYHQIKHCILLSEALRGTCSAHSYAAQAPLALMSTPVQSVESESKIYNPHSILRNANF
jgi:hypothetical protein